MPIKQNKQETAIPDYQISVELAIVGDFFTLVQWNGNKPTKIKFAKSKTQEVIDLLIKVKDL